jgi:hypothetical protein
MDATGCCIEGVLWCLSYDCGRGDMRDERELEEGERRQVEVNLSSSNEVASLYYPSRLVSTGLPRGKDGDKKMYLGGYKG